MKVYNLTDGIIDYRGRLISPNGGWVEIPDLSFIPDRDRKLEGKYLSFGSLPSWWHPPNLVPVAVEMKTEELAKEIVDEVKVTDEVKLTLRKPKDK